MSLRRAECCCGTCAVDVHSEPVIHGICHCDNCKKRTGSALGISAYFKEVDFSHVRGETHIYAVENERGKQARHFCPNCGTTLFWTMDFFSDLVGVAGGCFTERPLGLPTFSGMDERRCSWLSLSEEINTQFTT